MQYEQNPGQKKVKREGALFVVSLVMACIALVLFAIGVALDHVVVNMIEEEGALAILLIVFFALPIIVGIASEIFAIISFTNAAILFKRVKKLKSIAMFTVSAIELLFLPGIIGILLLLTH